MRPGVPADRVAILTKAFAEMVKDQQFLADAQKLDIDIDPLTAQQVTNDFAAMMSQPQEAVDLMLKYIKLEGGG